MKNKLLIIDDDQGILESYSAFLSPHFEVDICNSVEDGISMITKNKYPLALIDMAFPDDSEGGLRIIEHIEKTGIDTKSIILTAQGTTKNFRKAHRTGIYDYIEKGLATTRSEVLSSLLEAISKISDFINTEDSGTKPSIPSDALTPQEYLEYLQNKSYDNELPVFASDICDVLTANLIGSLPDAHRQKLDRIAIGVLPTRSVNAWVMQVPAGGEVIGFDFGIISFMLALNKILLSRINLFGFEPTFDFQTASEFAVRTVKSFLNNNNPPRLVVAPRKMIIASALSNVQTSFIVGHELGHVLLGHLRKYQYNAPPEHPHDQEYAADTRGAELVLDSYKKTYDPLFGTGEKSLSQAAIDIFFTYLDFMEKFIPNNTANGTSTHPSSFSRKIKLRERFWLDLPENSRQLAEASEKIFEGFKKMI